MELKSWVYLNVMQNSKSQVEKSKPNTQNLRNPNLKNTNVM